MNLNEKDYESIIITAKKFTSSGPSPLNVKCRGIRPDSTDFKEKPFNTTSYLFKKLITVEDSSFHSFAFRLETTKNRAQEVSTQKHNHPQVPLPGLIGINSGLLLIKSTISLLQLKGKNGILFLKENQMKKERSRWFSAGV